VLTVDYDRLRVRRGDRLLDAGCGAGRHAIEAARQGAQAIALDRSLPELKAARRGEATTREMSGGSAGANVGLVGGDATRLPFADATFDRVIASEVLEHLFDDSAAIAELVRVLRPGGTIAVTVPRYLPERICWALSSAYHTNLGGHLRIYRGDRLRAGIAATGLRAYAAHHAHALHSAYWWLRCVVGVDNDRHPLVRGYHSFLVWDLMRRPRITRALERVLNPLLGKSLVLYFERQAVAVVAPTATAAEQPQPVEVIDAAAA
jgi:SAM-dependent methyltransferase